MNLDNYPVVTDRRRRTYEFYSVSPTKTIKKVVFYQEIAKNVFNLAFGDWDEATQKINDRARSNNNDREKVLATVATTVMDFMKKHPRATLFAKGSTPARNRLYQKGISDNWEEIDQFFDIEGYYKDKWEPFAKSRNYQAFSLRAKQKNRRFEKPKN